VEGSLEPPLHRKVEEDGISEVSNIKRGSVVVRRVRCWSEGLGIDPQCCHWVFFFPELPTEPCALGSTQVLKMSTRKTPGGKDGRSIKVTTLPPS
jgi:hypothetical protein